jgi:hypothetical protein
MRKLPSNAFPKSDTLQVQFGGTYKSLEFPKDTASGTREERQFFYEHKNRCCISFDARHPLVTRYHKLEQAKKALREEIQKAKAAAHATLNKANSTKQLLELWPEVEPFIGDLVSNTPCVALAIPIPELNKTFGLPVAATAKQPAKKKKAA